MRASIVTRNEQRKGKKATDKTGANKTEQTKWSGSSSSSRTQLPSLCSILFTVPVARYFSVFGFHFLFFVRLFFFLFFFFLSIYLFPKDALFAEEAWVLADPRKHVPGQQSESPQMKKWRVSLTHTSFLAGFTLATASKSSRGRRRPSHQNSCRPRAQTVHTLAASSPSKI
jgi:hypothetical protein